VGKASRREFAKLGAIAGIGTALGSAEGLRAVGIAATNTAPASELAKPSSQEESSSRGRLIAPLINHVGYRPGAGKFIVIEDLPGAESFELVRVHKKGMSPVFVGKLASTGKDFGPYLLGDFSSFREPGIYRANVPVGNPVTGEDRLPAWSYDFGIGERVWDDSLHKLVNYYRLQACGASRHGYNSPCHTGKIERDDHGEAVPITGGWHSAHDHLRDLSEILHGVFGLLAVATARPDLEEELGLFDEIRWGNDYFLSLQSPPGYVCFGVYAKHYYDYERWDWWDSASYILITKPAALIFQHNFIAIQAMIAMLYQQTHPEYAARCREAGRRSFEWVRKQPGGAWGREKLSYELGTGVLAGVEMFRATGEVQYRKFAAALANQLVALQQPAGFFAECQGSDVEIAADYDLPVVRAVYAPLAQLGLCAAARWLADDPDWPRWKASLARFASFLKSASEANAFGLIPYRVYRDQPPVKTRSLHGLHYRYFLEPDVKTTIPFWKPDYWNTGSDAQAAGHGVVMSWMAEILGETWLAKLAQRQLDWITGANPFNASMILGVGRNQPVSYRSLEIFPDVPDIDGAVLQGPIGTAADEPLIVSNYWATAEFWMPHQAAVTWLAAEISISA